VLPRQYVKEEFESAQRRGITTQTHHPNQVQDLSIRP